MQSVEPFLVEETFPLFALDFGMEEFPLQLHHPAL
jgi:hypothetical protein